MNRIVLVSATLLIPFLSSGCLGGGGGGGSAPVAPAQTPILPVTATPANQPPTVTGLADSTSVAGPSTTLTVIASDPEGGPVSYSWTVSGSPPAPPRIASPAQSSTVIDFPLAGTYILTVRVTDGGGASLERSITITVDSRNSFAVQGLVQGSGSGAGGTSMALRWQPLGRDILVRSCDAAGSVIFSGLMGQPDDFSVRVAGAP